MPLILMISLKHQKVRKKRRKKRIKKVLRKFWTIEMGRKEVTSSSINIKLIISVMSLKLSIFPMFYSVYFI